MTEIGLDLKTQAVLTWNVQGTDVSCAGGSNALPAMMRSKLICETTQKVVRLADIYRVPVPVYRRPAKNIDARTFVVDRPDGMQLKLVAISACPKPDDNRERVD